MLEEKWKKIFVAALLLLVGVFSFLFLADRAGSMQTHASTLNVIGEKTEDVLRLTASASLASFAVSAIPGDTATPIAGKLADFSEYFMLILCVLYAEKYLVTIIGTGVFKIVIPLACALGIAGVFMPRGALRRIALKIALVGLALYAIIPFSFGVSDMIYEAYRDQIDGTITAAETLSDETAPLADAADDRGLIEKILDRLNETAASLTDRAVDAVNRFVETLAVMIVTSCVIPILVLLFFLWIIKQLTGIDITPSLPFRRRSKPAAGASHAQGVDTGNDGD